MSFSDKKTSALDVINQRRASFPSTGEIDGSSRLPTLNIPGFGDGGGDSGGGGGGSRKGANQNTINYEHKAPQDASSSVSLPASSTCESSPTSASDVQSSAPSILPVRKPPLANPSNGIGKIQPLYSGMTRNLQYPYGSAWSSLPFTARPYDPAMGGHGYPSYFGSESILDQMYRGTSGSLNLVSMGLQSVSNFTGVLNQFFMAIQSTLASLMSLTSQMHFIKDQFARAMSIFSLYRGLKWLIARLLQALGLKTQDDVETAWHEAASSFQTPAHAPRRRPWRKVLLTTLFITVPTLIIYILDVLNTPVTPPPRPPDGRGGAAGNSQTTADSPSRAPVASAVGDSTGQWPLQSSGAVGYSNPSFSSYRFSAPNAYNNSMNFNSSWAFNSPFSASSYPYSGTSNPYMGGVSGWGSYGTPLSASNSAYIYNGIPNRYNYGNTFSGVEPFPAQGSTYPAQHGYGGIAYQPQATANLPQNETSNSKLPSDQLNRNSELNVEAPTSQQSNSI